MTLPESVTRYRRLFIVALTLVTCLSVLFVSTLSAQDPEGSQDSADDQAASSVNPADAEIIADALQRGPEAVLYDNGPLVNDPGGAPGGADGSELQNTTLGMTTLGFGHQVSAGNRVADDFVITDSAGWQIDAITFYAYQTNTPGTTSTINEVNYRIWDGPPDDPASSVVFGDTTTNRLASTEWSGIYRYSEATVDTNRPIMANTVSAGVILPVGTYWLDWQTGGTLTSGPWAPPITIDGLTETGNGLQFTTAWNPANDGGTLTQQGFPFVIEGIIAGGPTSTPTSTAAPSATATSVACTGGGTPQTFYFSDFEADDGGWTESGFGEWEWGDVDETGTENCDSPTLPGPPGAYSGDNAWATNLDGCYANSGATSTLSQTFDFSSLDGPIMLSWWQWYSIFGTFDEGRVFVNGTEVYLISTSTPTTDYEQVMLDLSAYAGNPSVTIEYELDVTTVVNRFGWYIDDVEITGCTGGGGPTPTATSTGVVPTATATMMAATATATEPITSVQLGDISSDGGSTTPWLLLSLMGIAGLAGAAWVGARRMR